MPHLQLCANITCVKTPWTSALLLGKKIHRETLTEWKPTSASKILLKALAMAASIPTMSNSMLLSSRCTTSILKFYRQKVCHSNGCNQRCSLLQSAYDALKYVGLKINKAGSHCFFLSIKCGPMSYLVNYYLLLET